MATAAQGGWFRRKNGERKPALRVLTAAATPIDLSDSVQGRRQRALRQGWQSDAWTYRDAIGELRYAIQFLANCTARMRFYPAAYPADGESDNPVPISDLADAPPGLADLCDQAMSQLGHGKLAIKQIASALSTNTTVAGESWMLGRENAQTGEEEWSIRSIDEIVVMDDKWQMREIPSDPQGVVPWIELDPQETVLTRIWTPHPRFRLLADSPMRAMLDDCESLLILRRMIRATGRSRLAGRGLLGIPDELSIWAPNDDDSDPQSDPVFDALATAMTEPIADEGVASAVVPIVVRGPGEHLKNIVHIDFASQFDLESSKTREELMGIIATSLDLPKEVITGMAEMNHWSAWAVDDNTFRHHVEPHVITVCDSLTGAFLRAYLRSEGVAEEWVRRVVMWYDPTELVTHPDQTSDAKDLYDRHALSAEALARIAGFSEKDMPSAEETVVRMLQAMRTPPANLVMAAVHQMFPTLTIPPIETSGTVPGVKPTGVDTGDLPQLPAGPGAPALPPVAVDNAPPAVSAPPADQPDAGPPGVTASAGQIPPNYRPSDTPGESCHTCKFIDVETGLCTKFNVTVDRDHVCDAWQAAAAGAGDLDSIFAQSDGTYGDMWVNDAEKKALISFGDWEGDLVQPARTAAAAEFPGYEIDADAEVGAPDDPGWRQVYANGKRVDELHPPAVTAAGARQPNHRLSRKLAEIDRDLRTRIQTAANAALLRQLERAGARLRPKVAKDETLRAKIAHRANERVGALLGPDVVTAAGLTADQLLGNDWAGLRSQFMQWTEAAQRQALHTALRLGGIAATDAAAVQAQQALESGRDAAWEMLSGALTGLSHHLLYSPDPNTTAGDWGALNPNTLVPTGTIRAALGIAGGAAEDAVSTAANGAVSTSAFVGQIGTGSTISGLLTDAGGETDQWEWNHAGSVISPLESHEALDGVEFASFDDDALANPDSFPPNDYLFPGDHDGCTCDAMPLWSFPGSPINDSADES